MLSSPDTLSAADRATLNAIVATFPPLDATQRETLRSVLLAGGTR